MRLCVLCKVSLFHYGEKKGLKKRKREGYPMGGKDEKIEGSLCALLNQAYNASF